MKRNFLLLLSCLFVFGTSVDSWADKYGGFDINEADSVAEAVAEIKETLMDQNFEITAVIDHAANAERVGLALRPTQVILFRKLFFDVSLIRRSQTAAIDLPLKMLVYEDEAGNIKLKFNDVGYLVDRHEIRFRDFILRRLDARLDQFGMNDKGIIMIPSNQSVADTVTTLRSALEAAGFRIPIQIDFHEKFKRLPETTLLIFGNPNVGTQLMQNSQEIGLDLPQKFLVFEDSGQVKIAYNDPFFIAQRAGIQGLDTLLENIANALNDFANQGASPESEFIETP